MSDRVTIRVNGLAAKARLAIGSAAEPDSDAIADLLATDVSEDEIRRALKLVVEREASGMRREATQRAQREALAREHTETEAERREEATERLQELAEAHQDQVADQFFASWKGTPTGRKFLGECTAADLRWSAERHEDRSRQFLEAAGRDSRLADAIDRAGVATVRDLGYEAAAASLAVRES